MKINIPELSIVTLIGISGSGKSTFSKKYFSDTEILSSDFFRGLVCNDENDQTSTNDAFESLYFILNKRLKNSKLTVIDATNVNQNDRKNILNTSRENNVMNIAIVLNTLIDTCIERNKERNKNIKISSMKGQYVNLKKSIKNLRKEGFRKVYVIDNEEDFNNSEIIREKLWNNKKNEHGPFDIIGDIHGCYDELCELLEKQNYNVDKENFTAIPPDDRKVIFLGDIVDRGPKIVESLKLVMNMVNSNYAYAVPGNHDVKLVKKLKGANTQLKHGLEKTMEQFENVSSEFKDEVCEFLDSLISHYVLDNGNLVVSHAGVKEEFQGRSSGRVREFCLFGETTGETDEYGLPVRYDWTENYRGKALVIYGHTPNLNAENINNTINIDTGCVFGGKLTSYRYPENEIVSVNAKEEYYPPSKPLNLNNIKENNLLYIEDVIGKKFISTRLKSNIIIQEQNNAASLEIMSRFSVNPKFLIYLPPTMSPCETSKDGDFLEHPINALGYYKSKNVETVICEEKHMGSRAVIIVCKDNETCKLKFNEDALGTIYTRTGRKFFNDDTIQVEILKRINNILSSSNFWSDFNTNWVCLDCELMPWSEKAQSLLKEQYAPVGTSGVNGVSSSLEELKKYSQRMGDNEVALKIITRFENKKTALEKYTKSYRNYCWTVNSVDDIKIAAFHILATENAVHNDKNHLWHMENINKYMLSKDKILIKTKYLKVDLFDDDSIQSAINWWENHTVNGGEGMVVKPLDFIVKNEFEILQPAVKCRGAEYLRIIYGPEYNINNNLERLRKRGLSKKRNLAINEFSLGMESLERFVRNEPLYRVHECVFSVLALESEPVDPRL